MATGIYPRTQKMKDNLRRYWRKNPHPLYKGSEANYSAKHHRIHRRYGKADRCENPKCEGKSRIFEWANKSRKHLPVRSDWIRLCRSCHRKFDMTPEKWESHSKMMLKYWEKNSKMKVRYSHLAGKQKRDKKGRYIKN